MYQYHFLIPDPSSFPSGGNIFNEHLIAALVRREMHVSQSPFRTDLLMTSPDTVYILDSIYFEQITDPEIQLPPNCIGLIHHLNSLYPSSGSSAREKALLEKFAGFIATSRFTRQYLESYGLDPAHIHVIEPAPLLERKRPKEFSSRLKALILGNLVPRKGQLVFLEALAANGIDHGYQVTIAGSLTADEVYARQCTDLLLQHPALKKCVRIIGEQSEKSIPKLYEKSNLFISPSEMETFGMAIQDAVAIGIPVLALKAGYAAEHVVEGINGHRCNTPEELAKYLRHYVEHPEEFVRLQESANQYIPPYHTWDAAAQLLIEAFE